MTAWRLAVSGISRTRPVSNRAGQSWPLGAIRRQRRTADLLEIQRWERRTPAVSAAAQSRLWKTAKRDRYTNIVMVFDIRYERAKLQCLASQRCPRATQQLGGGG